MDDGGKKMASNYEKQVDIGRQYFLKYDPEKLAAKFHLSIDESYLYIRYLDMDYRIDRKTAAVEGKVENGYVECREYTIVMTIYDMLCHGTEQEIPALTGDWKLIGNFAAAGSSPDANLFAQKYADAFNGKVEELKAACKIMGGEVKARLAGADVTAQIPAFPFFPVLLQFWEGDDEFAPQIRILWDSQTMKFLNFETTYYLQGDLLDRLAELMDVIRLESAR